MNSVLWEELSRTWIWKKDSIAAFTSSIVGQLLPPFKQSITSLGTFTKYMIIFQCLVNEKRNLGPKSLLILCHDIIDGRTSIAIGETLLNKGWNLNKENLKAGIILTREDENWLDFTKNGLKISGERNVSQSYNMHNDATIYFWIEAWHNAYSAYSLTVYLNSCVWLNPVLDVLNRAAVGQNPHLSWNRESRSHEKTDCQKLHHSSGMFNKTLALLSCHTTFYPDSDEVTLGLKAFVWMMFNVQV